jgi:hypothetical protein
MRRSPWVKVKETNLFFTVISVSKQRKLDLRRNGHSPVVPHFGDYLETVAISGFFGADLIRSDDIIL